jgi:phosphatidylethanolamine-binding protein (PEBP) family uncharacterized protein
MNSPLRTVSLLLLLTVSAHAAAPAEGKKAGKGGKGGPPAGSVDMVAAAKPSEKNITFKLTSPAVKDGEKLPVEFTGDGASASPPLAWTGIPKGTQSLVLIMHHLDPEGKTKIYWLMHDIDPQTTSVAKNATDFGKMGISTVHNRVEYAPPHSKGPGEKKYVLTLFALSAKPDLKNAAQPITAEVLLAAIKGKILGAADLSVIYTRTAGASDEEEKRPARKGDRPNEAAETPPARPAK